MLMSTSVLRRRLLAIVCVAAMAASMLAFIGVGPAAATFVTVATEDEYRQALTDLSLDSSGPHTITLAGHITLSGAGHPTYTSAEPLTIDGSGYTIDGAGNSRILLVPDIPGGADVTFQDVTITNGYTTRPGGAGAGVYVVRGNLTVVNSYVTDNWASGDDGGGLSGDKVTVVDSAVISNTAGDDNGGVSGLEVEVIRSTIANNTAHGYRGEGAGIFGNQVTVVNSTITGNTLTSGSGGNGGGGIYARGPLTLLYSTVTDNRGPYGSNVVVTGDTGTLVSFGSVIAAPNVGVNCYIDAGTSSTYSYDTDGTCGFTGVGDISDGADPLLGPLADNGGPTPSQLPNLTSPLVDTIPATDCSAATNVDQRGVVRPQGGTCDIGAVEVFNFDQDGDGIPDSEDNCPDIPNPDQADADDDEFGAVCDCNDLDPNINPGMTEIPGNGIDDDCCPNTPPWGTPASVINPEYKGSSDITNYFFLLCVPVGAVLLWKGLKRRK